MRLSRTTFAVVLGVVLLFAVAAPTAKADMILVSAPSNGVFYYGMYCTSCIAAEFTLAGGYNVSTIDVELYTPTPTNFPTFDFSLQNSLTGSITTFASEALTAPLGYSTEVMNVDETLMAGTYYLVGNVPGYFGTSATPGDVDGWLLSTGVYIDNAGTITSLYTGVSPTDYSPAFTVNGSPAAAVPEPSSLVLLTTTGLLGMAALARRRLFDHCGHEHSLYSEKR